ncbi:Hypothetical protein I5071_46560 [Sandaracinus amylolyticus]|nr:Hypothetical protein I5071_46560 [Sandaracinus amylolyticus]
MCRPPARPARSLLVLALFVAASGCVRGPAARGNDWHTITTAHVRLTSDANVERAVEHAWLLEDFHLALAHWFPDCARGDDTTEVVILARDGEYDEIAPRESLGFFADGSYDSPYAVPARVVISAPAARENSLPDLFVHELTHRFVATCYPEAPPWLHEGLAEFFETMRVEDDSIVLGTARFRIRDVQHTFMFRSHGRTYADVPPERVPSATELVAMTPSAFYDPTGHGTGDGSRFGNYVGAWALVHMMRLGTDLELRARFREYLGALELGLVDEREAFARAFEDFPLDIMLEGHMWATDRTVLRAPYRPPVIARPVVEPLSPGAAHVTWATLLLRSGRADAQERARVHIAEAARDPRARADALLLRATLAEGTARERAIREAELIAPGTARVLRARGFLALAQNDVESARAISTALSGRSDLGVAERIVIAQLLHASGDLQGAAANASIAVQHAASTWEAQYVLGRVLADLGQAREARRALLIVLRLVGDGRTELTREVRALLDEL